MTRFRTEVLLAGKTATGVEVPAKVVEALGSTKRPLVRVTINGYTYRSAIAPMGGVFMLGISEEVRNSARVKAGDTVDVDLELDTEKRAVEVPPELKKALARDARAKKYFESLSYSRKAALVNPIAHGRTADTRERNLTKAMQALKAGKV
ncbi:MAG TPA: YdeI/OmpD-associated family protein [Candidatus Dormibacteraeota bacterium]|nr:YdeI/OmpD-associated family protein [Candidatus Dormibacteraeota bacterium]